MSRYTELTHHLARLNDQEWEAGFDEIEAIIGAPLPSSARQYQAWWANQRRAQSLSWQSAGWNATAVDLPRERVRFVYVGGTDNEQEAKAAPLTIAAAKAGLAEQFGVPVEAIEITIRG